MLLKAAERRGRAKKEEDDDGTDGGTRGISKSRALFHRGDDGSCGAVPGTTLAGWEGGGMGRFLWSGFHKRELKPCGLALGLAVKLFYPTVHDAQWGRVIVCGTRAGL